MKTQIRLTNKLQLMCSDLERRTLQALSLSSVDNKFDYQLYLSINKILKQLNPDPDYQALDHFIQVKYQGDLFL